MDVYHFAAILPVLENKYFSYILHYPGVSFYKK